MRVGITGHVDITGDTARRVADALRAHLAPIGALTGVTALAPGADTVFANVVLDLGCRLEVLLPSADYRQTQLGENTQHFDTLLDAADSVTVLPFDTLLNAADSVTVRPFDTLLDAADSVTVLPFDTLLNAADSVTVLPFDAAGPDAYAAANTLMLDMIDKLIAVWDGKPAQDRGGTGEAVAEAKRRGIPVVVIWPEGSVRG